MAEKNEIPAGFRFQATMLEVLNKYLRPRILGQPLPSNVMHEADVYAHHPEQLARTFPPCRSIIEEWWFFTSVRRDRNGSRSCRQSTFGRWHMTQSTLELTDNSGRIIGIKGSFTYMVKQEPKARWMKTMWLMEEFVYKDHEGLQIAAGAGGVVKLDDGLVVCRIYRTPSAREKPPSAEKKGKRKLVLGSSSSAIVHDNEGRGNMPALVAAGGVPSATYSHGTVSSTSATMHDSEGQGNMLALEAAEGVPSNGFDYGAACGVNGMGKIVAVAAEADVSSTSRITASGEELSYNERVASQLGTTGCNEGMMADVWQLSSHNTCFQQVTCASTSSALENLDEQLIPNMDAYERIVGEHQMTDLPWIYD